MNDLNIPKSLPIFTQYFLLFPLLIYLKYEVSTLFSKVNASVCALHSISSLFLQNLAFDYLLFFFYFCLQKYSSSQFKKNCFDLAAPSGYHSIFLIPFTVKPFESTACSRCWCFFSIPSHLTSCTQESTSLLC